MLTRKEAVVFGYIHGFCAVALAVAVLYAYTVCNGYKAESVLAHIRSPCRVCAGCHVPTITVKVIGQTAALHCAHQTVY